MPKDFQDYQSNPANWSSPSEQSSKTLDPNIYRNYAVTQEIKTKYKAFMAFEYFGKIVASTLLAPLLTIQVSLQCSVLPHKEKYHDTILNEKRDIIKSPNEITIQDKRRYEMVIKSGVTKGNMPFRAPVYSSYREVFKALSNQGFLGFYKGNMITIFYMAASYFPKKFIATSFKYSEFEILWRKTRVWVKMTLAIAFSTLTDLIAYPLMTMQSRFILQNRLPSFFVYKGIYNYVEKHKRRPFQFIQGWRGLVPYNVFMVVNMFNFQQENQIQGLWMGHNLANMLSYPFLTVMRRLQCQLDTPGMIPLRYGGVSHCFKLIANEEGLKGLYRGYAMHFIITNFMFLMGLSSHAFYSKAYHIRNIE